MTTSHLIDSLQSFEKKSASGTATSWDSMDVLNPLLYLKMWNDFGGQPSGLNGMIRFFKSDYCTALPTSRISSQLWADLLTDPQRPIKPSDGMDVNLLSVAMPICHFVVTDKDMENRLKRRQIDREGKTEVFSLSTIDVLLDRLEEIEKFPK